MWDSDGRTMVQGLQVTRSGTTNYSALRDRMWLENTDAVPSRGG